MNDFATTHRRWGYKRAWARAKSEGIIVGRDTFRRLWRAEGLRVRPRKAPKPRTAPRLQRLVKAMGGSGFFGPFVLRGLF